MHTGCSAIKSNFREVQSISVIVPVYNVQNYIERCIESILVQTYADFELLLVDDGSTDGSKAICTDFARRDKRVSGLDNNHGGVSAARNAGLDAAQGHYITFVDGDDVIHPQYLEILYGIIVTYGADIAVGNYRECRDTPSGIDFYNVTAIRDNAKTLSEEQVVKSLFDDICFMTVWGKLYKKDLIKGETFGHCAMGEDLEFNSRVFVKADKLTFADVPLYFWMMRSTSTVHSNFSRKNFDNVRSYYRAYSNVVIRSKKYGAYALGRLYKNILSMRYVGTKEYSAEIKKINKRVIKETGKDFLLNPYLGAGFKVSIMIFLCFPFTYRMFRSFMAGHFGLQVRSVYN